MDSKQTYGIVGLGLMGGAIAIALREKCGIPQERLFACDTNCQTLGAAKERGLIFKGYNLDETGEMLSACDVVFVCLNPLAVIYFLEKWAAYFKKGSIVTDIAGTKGNIASYAKRNCEEGANFDFIPGHPMAGAEKGGFINSHLVDFMGKNYILTPLESNRKDNIDLLKNLIYKMGFGKITETTPKEHDSKIAFTSQLCHVIAASLIDCESDTEITRFGGGSFEDLTRIAMLNAPMWTEIFMENRTLLLERIDQFEKSLNELKNLIDSEDSAELEKKLEKIRDRRLAMHNAQCTINN